MLEGVFNQLNAFWFLVISGLVIGLFFDFFRVIRSFYNFNTFWVSIQDLIFWIFSTVCFFYTVLNCNDGEIRFYQFLTIILSILLYFSIFSKYGISLITILIKIICFPFVVVFKIFKKPMIFVWNIGLKTQRNFFNRFKEIKKISKKI